MSVAPTLATISEPRDVGADIRDKIDLDSEAHFYGDDASFWASLAMPSALEAEGYTTIESMADSATVVIIGRVKSTGVTRTLDEPVVGGAVEVSYWGIEVEVLEVLVGELEPGSGEETVIVESIVPTRRTNPQGAAIFFLRHKLDPPPGMVLSGPVPDGEEDKYRLVNSQGLFIDSPDGVRNPIVEAKLTASSHFHQESLAGVHAHDHDIPADPVAEQVRGRSFGDLVRMLRARS